MSARLQHGEIVVDNKGLKRIVHSTDVSISTSEVGWFEIRKILAFKRDLFAHDLICVAIETSSGSIEIDEQMSGWEEFVQALPKHLPGARCAQEWVDQVARPVFAANITQLFPPIDRA